MKSPDTRQIEEYVVTYYAGGARSKRPYKYRATIDLRNSIGQFGSLFFHWDAATLPDCDQLSETGMLSAHFLIEDMPRVLDILRNEGPVYFHRYPHWPTMGMISTSREPVGEGELGGVEVGEAR